MTNQGNPKLLGTKLIEAGIISEQQLKVALEDQRRYNLRIGEILAKHDWLKQRTADFFAQEWEIAKTVYPRQPIGYYLKRAALLNETQISYILDEQEKKVRRRFGEIAVEQKWLNSQTISFFLKSLEEKKDKSLNDSKTHPATALKRAILYINEPDIVIIGRKNIIYELRDFTKGLKSKPTEIMSC